MNHDAISVQMCLSAGFPETETDALLTRIDGRYRSIIDAQTTEIAQMREVLNLALEYWADRQQRYKNRSPVWVQKARAALSGENHG